MSSRPPSPARRRPRKRYQVKRGVHCALPSAYVTGERAAVDSPEVVNFAIEAHPSNNNTAEGSASPWLNACLRHSDIAALAALRHALGPNPGEARLRLGYLGAHSFFATLPFAAPAPQSGASAA